MKPTDEQNAIIKAGSRMVRINARAGTGKTTTLAMLAKQQKGQRILYLVFNRRAREEARKQFPSNTDVYTIHALAYRREGYKWKETLGHFSPADMLSFFKPEEQVLATLSHDFLVYFLNSHFSRLEDAVKSFKVYLSGNLWEQFECHQNRVIHAARSIATEWNTGRRHCPHDFYLKLFHKSGGFYRELDRYDLILVDEAQDLSPIMLDALRKCSKRIFLVGDSHQQIYSFRYAIDAMQKISCQEEFDLTLSFRFGKAIAELAALFIQESKLDGTFRIEGTPHKSSQVSLFHNVPTKTAQKTAILSRSNVGLFDNAMHLRSYGAPFGFEKDIYPLLMRTLDVYWLSRGRRENIREPLIKSFQDVEHLEEYADETGNSSLLGMIRIVENYAEEFPDVIFEMAALTQQRNGTIHQKGAVLSTIHSAKGQEYEQVYIDRDMAENIERVMENELEHASDEVNVAYVGFTRAMQHLHVPFEFLDLLTPKWMTFLEGYQPKSGQKSRPARTYRRLRIGDYVRTPQGTGIILDMEDEYCLIDLATKDVMLREHISNIKPHTHDKTYQLRKRKRHA